MEKIIRLFSFLKIGSDHEKNNKIVGTRVSDPVRDIFLRIRILVRWIFAKNQCFIMHYRYILDKEIF